MLRSLHLWSSIIQCVVYWMDESFIRIWFTYFGNQSVNRGRVSNPITPVDLEMDKKVEEKLLKRVFFSYKLFLFQSLIQFTVERSKWTFGSGRLINGIPKQAGIGNPIDLRSCFLLVRLAGAQQNGKLLEMTTMDPSRIVVENSVFTVHFFFGI